MICIGFYFWSDNSETPFKEATIAIAVYVSYLVLYLLVEPFPAVSSKYIGQLYGFLPMLAFGAILFPQLNTNSPEVVTRVLGWLGISSSFLLLSYFKLFVW